MNDVTLKAAFRLREAALKSARYYRGSPVSDELSAAAEDLDRAMLGVALDAWTPIRRRPAPGRYLVAARHTYSHFVTVADWHPSLGDGGGFGTRRELKRGRHELTLLEGVTHYMALPPAPETK